MKFSKYLDLVKRHPYLESIVNWMWVAPTKHYDRLVDFVHEKIDYIAYRPWENLDLNSGNHRDSAVSVHYDIHFWIDGDKVNRLRHVANEGDNAFWNYVYDLGDPEPDEVTIKMVMDSLRSWWKECFEQKGIGIRYEAVVKYTYSFETKKRSVEVYPFPENFTW